MKKYEITKIENTCLACPAQWEGTTKDNRPVYIRYRWGCLSVRIGEVGEDIIDAVTQGQEIIFTKQGGEWDGTMGYETLKRICGEKILFP